VYFAKNVRVTSTGATVRTLPMLVIPLRGDGVKLNIRGTTAVSPSSKLVTTFAGIPDAPVSRFDLQIAGGKRGILVATRGVCGRSRATGVGMAAHSGKQVGKRLRLAAACKRKR
jgi:hypothetical protein